MKSIVRTSLAVCIISLGSPLYTELAAEEPDRPNADSAFMDRFTARVDDYMKIHNTVKGKLPAIKPTQAAPALAAHEREFRRLVRELRPEATQGNIFTPEIADYFRRRIQVAMKGPQKDHVRQSLAHSEPVKVPLRVNDSYPDGLPLQSTPPTLLLNLPKIPRELEYRVVGHGLVLRDVEANITVDFIPNAIP